MNTPIPSSLDKIRERIALLRKESISPESTSPEVTPTPLPLFLAIHYKAYRLCYLDYNAGTKALIDWLSPIDFELEKHTDLPVFPRILYSYDINELAQLLVPLNDDVESIEKTLILQAVVARIIIHAAYKSATSDTSFQWKLV